MEFSKSSLSKLKGVHPDLVRVVMRCAKDWKDKQFTFGITCGVRTIEEQRVLVKKGASRTMNSRHIPAKNGFSHAVDVVAMIDGEAKWDWSLYIKIANAMKAAAIAENVPVVWGGNWKLLSSIKGQISSAHLSRTFPDGPHFECDRKVYPGNK